MSKIEQLITTLCPNGVVHKSLKEVCRIERGKRVTKSMLSDTGTYPVYQNCLTPMGYYNETNCPGNTPIVIVGGAAGEIGFIEVDFWAADDCVFLIGDTVTNRFVYHYLQKNANYIKANVRRASIPRLPRSVIEEIMIPVPPLSVQCEIVRILDNFSEHTEELTAKLTAELTARQKQYEYYRDYLLSFPNAGNLQSVNVERERERPRSADEIKRLRDLFGVVSVTIAEIAATNIGLATSVTQHKAKSGVILLHNSDIQPNRIVVKNKEFISETFAYKNKKKILHTGDIITVHTGDVGTSAVITNEYDGAIGFTTITSRIKDTTIISPEYLCNFLNSHACKEQIASMSISDRNNLNQSSFERIVITIPCLAEQDRINTILRKMDIMCSGILDGLPAEIEARRKQYEYYLDKLMTFKIAQG